jgi:UDP:flavonoid glycosyltransferase YjiC (YdhE family)
VVALGRDADPDLFLTHAGFGGVREALSAGVPMVALPLFADQPANAKRLAELGVGVVLRPDEADATALEVACRKVLDDSAYRLAARGYQRRILSLPGAGRLVADLTTLVD